MVECPFGLSLKEREVLRLLTQGHDTKSAASALGLSIHTIHERLREARRKTGASSSRGAARLLVEQETPELLGSTKTGVAKQVTSGELARPIDERLATTISPSFLSRWGVPSVIAASILIGAIIAAGKGTSSRLATSGPSPSVVATSPAQGAVVAAGPAVLSVRFDRAMRGGSYSFVRKDPATYPDCGDNRPSQSDDGRTFTLHCVLLPGRTYEIWFNSPPYMNFVSQDGEPAVPYQLLFRTR